MSDLTTYASLINAQATANNNWSAAQAQKQMNFQKEMSDTAHQREVTDLQKAGLNPVLSAMNGNGAASASGAMGQTDTSGTTALASILSKVLDISENNSAASAYRAASGYIGSSFGSTATTTSAEDVPDAGDIIEDLADQASKGSKGIWNFAMGFINGVTGNEKGKYNSEAGYAAGQKIHDSYKNNLENSAKMKVLDKDTGEFRPLTEGEKSRNSWITTIQKALTGSSRKLK